MRSIALTLVPLFLLACDREPVAPDAALPPSFAATSEWTEQVGNDPAGDGTWAMSCIDDVVDIVGPSLMRFHAVTTADGSLFSFQWLALDGYRLVGDKTGVWNAVEPNRGTLTERFPGAVGSYVLHYTLNQVFVNETRGARLSWPFKAKVTIDANGQIRVDRVMDPGCSIVGK